ncbi:hypothetical protein [Streptomyces sp. NPDC053079]|uniref:hypothetical protein n=1 Tax=Streptomyces sp. NPDC053079 TaxID=3365697 RepID=UPI0037D2512A
MLIADAVLETIDVADFALWPVAALPPYGFLALSGRMSMPEVGTAMAILTDYNSGDSDDDHGLEDDRPASDPAERVRRLITTDHPIARGGVRLRDTGTGVTVNPGCCCGLEDWHEWFGIPNGDLPWLGHDPSPRIEPAGQAGHAIRLWPDGGDADEAPSTDPIELALADLPGMLGTVRDELRGFLSLVEQWAGRYVPSLGGELTARIEAALAPPDSCGPPGRRDQGAAHPRGVRP